LNRSKKQINKFLPPRRDRSDGNPMLKRGPDLLRYAILAISLVRQSKHQVRPVSAQHLPASDI